jgi:hypothetical protein
MQCHNPVTEQELLAITETLKYYKHMLFGHKIVVKTDHKNLAHQLSTHASDRVLHQCLLHKEYGVDLQYIQGEKMRQQTLCPSFQQRKSLVLRKQTMTSH